MVGDKCGETACHSQGENQLKPTPKNSRAATFVGEGG